MQGFEKNGKDSQSNTTMRLGPILLILTLLFSVPCVGAQSTATESLAEINGDTITTEELNRALGTRLAQIEEQVCAFGRTPDAEPPTDVSAHLARLAPVAHPRL